MAAHARTRVRLSPRTRALLLALCAVGLAVLAFLAMIGAETLAGMPVVW
ncbi:MAG TPA: hypothetical protein VGJ13_05050 [Pseudonocardiaceae bacterium]|jgi:hypothetical protein